MERRAQALGHGPGRGGRDGIAVSVQHDRGNPEGSERGAKVIVPERGPDLLLGSSGYPERSEVAGPCRITEVRLDAQLEQLLLVGRGILLPEAALAERPAPGLQRGGQVPAGKLGLERLARRTPGRCGRNEREAGDPVGVLRRVEEREQSTPRIADDGQALAVPGLA